MSEPYKRYREWHEDISGSLNVSTAGVTSTLVTAKSQDHCIFIQKVHTRVTTLSAGKSWKLEDSNGTPKPVSGAMPTDAAPATFDLDFGAVGLPLTAGKNFVNTISAAGAAGTITWEGYMRPVSSFSLFVSK